jgi:predicted DNA-binding mobile mystery protein A
MTALRDLALRQLDATLEPAATLRALTPPRTGWAAAIRCALGLTMRQMGKQLGLSQSSYADAESNEAKGTISLNQLRRVADALECDLVYVLVPRRPLAERVDQRATELARRDVLGVAHSMALERQAPSEELTQAQIARAKADLLAGRWSRLWD